MADVVDGDAVDVTGIPSAREEYGVRATWQSEDERIEAAEFLIATRLQEHARRRVAALALSLRMQHDDEVEQQHPSVGGQHRRKGPEPRASE